MENCSVVDVSITGLQKQFDIRSGTFEVSAAWITDKRLIGEHVRLAGKPSGPALDLCCGTGVVGRALAAYGWQVRGLDISAAMTSISSRYFPVVQGNAGRLPFAGDSFRLSVCRQTFQFLDARKVLAEISRVLVPGGIFILSLTVPFSEQDREWLRKIHTFKQDLLLKFYTQEDLAGELSRAGYRILETVNLRVRESVTGWMRNAPELRRGRGTAVVSLVKNAPIRYKRLHRVKEKNGDVSEDWNWVIFKAAAPLKKIL